MYVNRSAGLLWLALEAIVMAPSTAYTQRTRQALAFAEEEARALNHNYIGTEHLLLGLLRVADGVAAHILRELGADESGVREAVIASVGIGGREVTGTLGHTPRARAALDLAGEQASRLGHSYIGTEHVLLGPASRGRGAGRARPFSPRGNDARR